MINREVWRDIPEAPGYCISNFGRVKNGRFGRMLKPYTNRPGGYLRVQLGDKQYYVHKLVASVFVPGYHEDCGISFRNGDHTDVSWMNLKITDPYMMYED